MRLPDFLPQLSGLRLTTVVVDEDGITVAVRAVRRWAVCPQCGRRSRRVHSAYTRTLRDLPWSGAPVTLRVRARRFFCRAAVCARRIFCERLPDLVASGGRRSHGLRAAHGRVGFALGGRPGARLAAALGLAGGRTTLLRAVRATPVPPVAAPDVVGVDDWARRRGRAYGTVLVDLERRRPVDLLPERSADGLAAWLAARPRVRIVSRDRSKEYAEGIRRGAPAAVQVADRWHLLKNLGDVLERLLTRRPTWLRAGASTPGDVASPILPPPPLAERARAARQARWLASYGEVVALHRQGASLSGIARHTGLARNTVLKYVRAGAFPERRPRRPGPASLLPFETFLRTRWAEGCRSAPQLWRELRERGYSGSAPTVGRVVARWKADGTLPLTPGAPGAPAPTRDLAPRHAAWLLTQPRETLAPAEHQALHQLRRSDPAAEAVYALAQEFRRLVRDRDAAALPVWLWQARGSGVRDLHRFAAHLERDEAAVRAALTLPWSNGQVEGQVNRLKTVKRQMYGRANFDLLRLRYLAPP